jgi:hypothetical protein
LFGVLGSCFSLGFVGWFGTYSSLVKKVRSVAWACKKKKNSARFITKSPTWLDHLLSSPSFSRCRHEEKSQKQQRQTQLDIQIDEHIIREMIVRPDCILKCFLFTLILGTFSHGGFATSTQSPSTPRLAYPPHNYLPVSFSLHSLRWGSAVTRNNRSPSLAFGSPSPFPPRSLPVAVSGDSSPSARTSAPAPSRRSLSWSILKQFSFSFPRGFQKRHRQDSQANRKVINISLFPPPPRPFYSIRRITGKLSGFLLNIPSVRKGIIDATFNWSVRKVHKELCVFFLGKGVGLQIIEFMRYLLVGVGVGESAALSAGPVVGALWLVGISVRVWFLGSLLRLAFFTSFGRSANARLSERLEQKR